MPRFYGDYWLYELSSCCLWTWWVVRGGWFKVCVFMVWMCLLYFWSPPKQECLSFVLNKSFLFKGIIHLQVLPCCGRKTSRTVLWSRWTAMASIGLQGLRLYESKSSRERYCELCCFCGVCLPGIDLTRSHVSLVLL